MSAKAEALAFHLELEGQVQYQLAEHRGKMCLAEGQQEPGCRNMKVRCAVSVECNEGDGAGKVSWGQITADVQS